ncbi:MAG: type I restriction-modification system subunit M [Planctomycetes bacterium]|nr:type I restriction-modification system subunit M [Planctomycetota bacterium]
MITGQLRSKIDKLWEEFWTGGVTNPLTVIEQISFLMFARLLDMRESTEEKKWSRKNPGKPFPGVYFPRGKQELRWSHLKQEADADKILKIVRDEVFPHFRQLGQSEEASTSEGPKNTFNQYMKDATLMINKPSLLMSAINMIDVLPLTQGDTKGDLYEYLLSKLTTAGINGQFRTPRHIIDLMVDLVLAGNEEEAISWTVGDPACGTGGFLVQFMEALRKHFTSEEGVHVDEETGGKTYTGDLIEPSQWKHIKSEMFHGFDFDVTMLRIAAMNMMLHEIDRPDINYQDTLSTNFTDRKETRRWAEDAFDLILANPPFKGSLDEEDVHKTLTGKVKTKKTELLFIVLILRMLKLGGRCAIIVPDGVTFGSSKAHKDLRQMLVEENQLEAVIKLPSGVFKPYAGVSTAILLFTKGGQTDNVFFFDVQADGKTLDDKRDKIGAADDWQDLDVLREAWPKWNGGAGKKHFKDRAAKAFFVPKSEIEENAFDLSINRYKEIVHEEEQYDSPKVILGRLKKLEAEIASDLLELEAMLGCV